MVLVEYIESNQYPGEKGKAKCNFGVSLHSLIQFCKTLILAYVTIPPVASTPTAVLAKPECLQLYSVREVVVRRFVPARMRD
jgi:hypothetical protein